MDAKKLYELNQCRQERNMKIDLASERFAGCVVNGEKGNYSTVYSIQINESNAVIEIVRNKLENYDNFMDSINEEFQKAITDSISVATKHPISEEEVSFLFVNDDKHDVKSVKFQNLFAKSQFSIVDFLKNASHIIANVAINAVDATEDITNDRIFFLFKCICCSIFTISSFIQNMTIEFDEKFSKILFSLIDNENGLIGIDKNVFISNLLSESNSMFANEEDINSYIDKLVDLGCVEITDSENPLIKLKEKVIRS